MNSATAGLRSQICTDAPGHLTNVALIHRPAITQHSDKQRPFDWCVEQHNRRLSSHTPHHLLSVALNHPPVCAAKYKKQQGSFSQAADQTARLLALRKHPAGVVSLCRCLQQDSAQQQPVVAPAPPRAGPPVPPSCHVSCLWCHPGFQGLSGFRLNPKPLGLFGVTHLNSTYSSGHLLLPWGSKLSGWS